MATNTDVKIKKPPENQELNSFCENLKLSNDEHKPRKRISSSVIINASPKKKKKDSITSKQFLLGGTLSDPLNLNSLQDEDVNKAMNKTPKSSPLRANTINIKKDQVNVIIPKNLADPLELSTCTNAKDVSHMNSHSLKQKTPQKSILLKTLSKSDSFIENTLENKNKSEFNGLLIDMHTPSDKKFKTEPIENNIGKPENDELCIIEVIEEIKDLIDSELLVKLKCNTHSIPKTVEPFKITSSPCEKILNKISVACPIVQEPTVDKHKSQQAVIPKRKSNKNVPKFKEKNELFKYGNYNRYYGYRNPENEDNRLKVLSERIELFYDKNILDIGCNIGHVTFSVARDFGAKSVVGLDIDHKLINIARKNVQYYINDSTRFSSHLELNSQLNNYKSSTNIPSNSDKSQQSFPTSLSVLYGPITLPCVAKSGRFPHNVSFIQGNYVLEYDSMLSMETCKFDVILCLSITKWLHLNWGDDGLKRSFKRMYQQLTSDGVLVLEAQPWKSYGRRKSLTATIWRNYNNIQLRPAMFTEYLLNEVGFSKCETLVLPNNSSKGFQRPLKLYFKSNASVNRKIKESGAVELNCKQKK